MNAGSNRKNAENRKSEKDTNLNQNQITKSIIVMYDEEVIL